MLRIYEVPELMKPQRIMFATVISNINSWVNGLMTHKNIPTQKPIHIGQVQK
jgi:hypothetical protein